MKKYVLKRLIDLSIVLLGMSILVFLMIRLIPGDAVAIMLGANSEITDASLNELRARLGLALPILVQ
jgi:peptide/nickel transport system permease protein